MSPGIERRKHPRHKIVIRIKQLLDGSHQYYYSRDLSAGGIFLDTRSPYPEGSRLQLDFQLPGRDKRVQVTGQVARSVAPDPSRPGAEPGMGVVFKEFGPGSEEELRAFLRGL